MDKIINTNISFYQQSQVNNSVNSTRTGKIMSQDIDDLINTLNNASSHDEIVSILEKAVEQKEIEKLDPITYRKGNYLIQDLLKISGEAQSRILERLNKEDIKLAPTLVAAYTHGSYTTLISKIDGMEGEDLIPFNEGYNLLDDSSKKEAFQDIKKLMNKGLINQGFFVRGYTNWFITPKTHKIVVPNWKGLRTVENMERQKLLSSCYNIIYR